MKNIDDITLHSKTRQQLKLIASRQPQVILLHGKQGVGLYTIATALALQFTNQHGILEILPDDKGSIKIDTIRELYNHTRTKHTDTLVIIIDNSDAMLAPAQNALLKLLEDTPKNTMFLLTTHQPQQLLPTIRSRAQEIEVLPISQSQTVEFLATNNGFDAAKKPQLLFLAQGLPAELHRLINQPEYLSQRIQEMSQAKEFLAQAVYEKLVTIYKLSNDRATAAILIQDCLHIAGTTLKSRADVGRATLLQSLLVTEQKIHNDGHIRTQLMNLAISTT